jgi:hypothetical protein
MQPLPNCSPLGGDATRLTYAVELKPKGILPVKLIEGRIASDLKTNLKAIRNHVEALIEAENGNVWRQAQLPETKVMSTKDPGVQTAPSIEMNTVFSGIKAGQEIEDQDLQFSNKILKQRIEELESEIMKKEDLLNSIRKMIR